MPDDLQELEKRFTAAMIEIYTRALKECNIRARRFHEMVVTNGGRRTAQDLLHSSGCQDGFTDLYFCDCLHLTMEALIVENPEWHPLFTQEELQIARKRLAEHRYEPRRTP
ncbi:MAG: hypothetical protein FJ290_23505 [Planctomycetes bacterium]|nr:hypothetical protein [Planctomycetota bacterium]